MKPAEVFEMEKRMLGSDVEIDEPSGGAEEGTAPSEWLTDERDTPENTIARGAYENTIENLLPKQSRSWMTARDALLRLAGCITIRTAAKARRWQILPKKWA